MDMQLCNACTNTSLTYCIIIWSHLLTDTTECNASTWREHHCTNFLQFRDVCSAHFCYLNHFCHSSPVLSIHINRFCQPHHFCQLVSPQSSPVLSTISTTYVAKDEVTTFVNKARPLLSTLILRSYLWVLCSVTL